MSCAVEEPKVVKKRQSDGESNEEEDDDEQQQPSANGFTDENQQWLKPKKTKKVRVLAYDGISPRCPKRSTHSRERIDLSLP